MTEKFFFDDWVGKTIKFTTTNPPSEWKLVTKLSDKNTQQSAESYHESPSPGAAYGSFICHNANDPADVAFMRIIMQYALDLLDLICTTHSQANAHKLGARANMMSCQNPIQRIGIRHPRRTSSPGIIRDGQRNDLQRALCS
jgi:hypothetical protein